MNDMVTINYKKYEYKCDMLVGIRINYHNNYIDKDDEFYITSLNDMNNEELINIIEDEEMKKFIKNNFYMIKNLEEYNYFIEHYENKIKEGS
ncbi:hypothetical protein [Clostridioides difficile]|uniref:hypothetical protein n=1 Tax=Clostridioides difficile TaxID=1496 RepID=UPI0029C22957|nr:hypothetical protein [Clostridioides difficile]MDX5664238.1 hypothetical protein [Clostridioides difficile]